MSQKKAILLDMYGVILQESKGYFIPYTYEHFDESEYERITYLFRKEKLFTKAGNGEISSDEFLTLLGYQDPQYRMRDYIENYLTLDPSFVPFAERFYQERDFILLSNDVSEWSAHITSFYRLDKYFRHKIVSGDVKCRKPDKHIFEIALSEINKQPSDCLFIDNSVENLRAAEELGIIPILFNRDGVEYDGITVSSFEELAEIIAKEQL
ncbi:MAG: HAD-IA family hydrolase [Oscillospiraceae bacterium]|nr:HAD-IA family hydrolase [Oscillospiraceae bacterium]